MNGVYADNGELCICISSDSDGHNILTIVAEAQKPAGPLLNSGGFARGQRTDRRRARATLPANEGPPSRQTPR